ncbi:mycofactocin precursor MftA [Ferrimicrobium sp.]|uniref:Mycofactocin MftA n=1 Tax=Ferrimicrobium acidiphilum TaxID=121039 RepID=A0ABV3Y160_9ACTN|nr:mycofactocin precursor MftA [Ferrimicrobium sp.]MCL5973726.1 mycofactocin precursor MftA [Actinomycetota bacterium]
MVERSEQVRPGADAEPELAEPELVVEVIDIDGICGVY